MASALAPAIPRVLAPALAGLALASGCGSGPTPAEPEAGASASSTSGVGGGAHSTSVSGPSTSTASSGSGGSSCGSSCEPPATIPAGWERLPGAPDDCNVFFAPTREQMRPPSPWKSCGDGCLELVNDWSEDPTIRLYGAVGGAGDGGRYIAYKRPVVYGELDEEQIIKLPENIVVFDAMMSDPYHDRCTFGVFSAGPHGHLIQNAYRIGDGYNKHRTMAYVVRPDSPVPELSLDAELPGLGFLYTTVSSDLWAVIHQGAAVMEWHGLDFSPEMKPLYKKPGQALFGPASFGSDVFFSTWAGDVSSELMAWDPTDGPRKLVAFGSKNEGGACCLATDGKQMVWFQGSGYQGKEIFEKVDVMVAPHTTRASDLKPKVLRPSYQNTVLDGAPVIGGGYAVHLEQKLGDGSSKLVITRLSDGHYWVVPHREPLLWLGPLYVDGEEFAVLEGTAPGNPNSKPGYFWSIVRRSIASLGEPLPPGSGF